MKQKSKRCIVFICLLSFFGSLYSYEQLGENQFEKPLVYKNHKIKKTSRVHLNRQPASIENKKKIIKTLNVKQSANQFRERDKKGSLKIYEKISTYPHYIKVLNGGEENDPLMLKHEGQRLESIGYNNASVTVETNKTYFDIEDNITIKVMNFFNAKPEEGINLLRLNQAQLYKSQRLDHSQIISIPASKIGTGKHLLQIESYINKERVYTSLGIEIQRSNTEHIKTKGSFVDSIGDLVFTNKLRFNNNGLYVVRGILYDRHNQMIAQSQSFVRVNSQVIDVDLKFYGKVFNDLRRSGPYTLKRIEVNKVDDNLSYESSEYFVISHKSPYFDFNQFRNDSYLDQDIEKKMNWLQ